MNSTRSIVVIIVALKFLDTRPTQKVASYVKRKVFKRLFYYCVWCTRVRVQFVLASHKNLIILLYRTEINYKYALLWFYLLLEVNWLCLIQKWWKNQHFKYEPICTACTDIPLDKHQSTLSLWFILGNFSRLFQSAIWIWKRRMMENPWGCKTVKEASSLLE